MYKVTQHYMTSFTDHEGKPLFDNPTHRKLIQDYVQGEEAKRLGKAPTAEELKKAVDEIYKYPLKEFAKETFNRQLKAGIDDYNLAALTVSLREDGRLCNISDDEENPYKEPQIICSMGLKNRDNNAD